METGSSFTAIRKAKEQRRCARWFVPFCLLIGTEFANVAVSEDPKDTFSIQVIEPYPVAPSVSTGELTLDEKQIAQLACRSHNSSELAPQLLQGGDRTKHRSELEQQREVVACLIANVASQKIRNERTAAALKAHYGLYATQLGADLIKRTELEIEQQTQIQMKLIEAGVSIPDDSLLTRIRNETIDSKLRNDSNDRILRIQLAGLISNQMACSYAPNVTNEMVPCDIDVCEYVQRALDCHYELVALGKIGGMLGPESVELGDELLALLSKVPVLPSKQVGFLAKLKSTFNSNDRVAQANRQKNWLNSLIRERRGEIAREIEIAYEKKRTAALRWSVAKEQLDVWSRRIAQLEKLGTENRGTIGELGAAKLAILKAEALTIELWLEWQTADVDLKRALGSECLGY